MVAAELKDTTAARVLAERRAADLEQQRFPEHLAAAAAQVQCEKERRVGCL